jgi:hypothetical protein
MTFWRKIFGGSSAQPANATKQITTILILVAGHKPADEMGYIQQVLPAVGLSLKALAGAHIDINYISAENLTQAYVMGLAMAAGHDVNKCTLIPFTDRDGGSGLLLKVFA